jgi:hypothetical protein
MMLRTPSEEIVDFVVPLRSICLRCYGDKPLCACKNRKIEEMLDELADESEGEQNEAQVAD